MPNIAAIDENVAATESAMGNPGSVGGRSGNPVNDGMPENASAIVPYPPRFA